MAGAPGATDACEEVTLHYPMWVMPMQVLLGLTSLLPHQDLKTKSRLVQFVAGNMVAIFVSHQWVALLHPDPDMRQFRILQGALCNVFSGAVKVQGDAAYQQAYKSLFRMTDDQLRELSAAHVWYDWFSCPQISARSATQEVSQDLQAAVDSIPAYVHLSSYFIILAPTVTPSEPIAAHIDYWSWRSRGWCRLELFAWVAATAESKPPIILIKGIDMIHFTTSMGWLDNMPGTGTFTVERDRVRIRGITESMLVKKLRRLRSKEDLHDWRFFKALRGRILKGLAEPPRYDRAVDFLADFEFRDALETCQQGAGAGWTPLHYAAITGGDVVAHLVSLRCDPDSRTQQDYPAGMLMARAFPLMLAAAFGPRSTVRSLLELRAGLNITDNMGFTALMAAVRSRDDILGIIEDLICARADVNQASKWPVSYTTLNMAAALGSADVISAVVEARADLSHSSFAGTALTTAIIWNGAHATERLLQLRMDPNARWDTRWSGRWLLSAAARVAYSFGVEHCILELLAISDGATPLLCAAFSGSTQSARLLLAARACPEIRNSQGMSPAKLAALHGHNDIVNLLAEHGADTTAAPARLPLPWACTACACEVKKNEIVGAAVAAVPVRTGDAEEEEELAASPVPAKHGEVEEPNQGVRVWVTGGVHGARKMASL